MPLLIHLSLALRNLPKEIYAYSISLILIASSPLIVLYLKTFDVIRTLRLRDLPETIGFPALFLSNLLSAIPILLPLIVALRSLELAIIVIVSVVAVLLVPFSPLASLIPLPLLFVQAYEVSLLYVLLPATVLLTNKVSRCLRGIFICGIALFPHHILLPFIAIIFTSIPLLGSGKVYIATSGMGILNPDFSKSALVIDAAILQILLILFPFTILACSRSLDFRLKELRRAVRFPLKHRLAATLTALVILASLTLSTGMLLNHLDVLVLDCRFFLHLSVASVFANLILPSDPDNSSRLFLSLMLYALIGFSLPVWFDVFLLMLLVILYDADVVLRGGLLERLSKTV